MYKYTFLRLLVLYKTKAFIVIEKSNDAGSADFAVIGRIVFGYSNLYIFCLIYFLLLQIDLKLIMLDIYAADIM